MKGDSASNKKFISFRLDSMLDHIITQISRETGIAKSEIIREALYDFLGRNPELPFSLRVLVTRVMIERKIKIIKSLKRILYMETVAETWKNEASREKGKKYPIEATEQIKKLEEEILEIINKFKRDLKTAEED